MVSIEELMIEANNSKASDVHITAGVPPKMRVNGELADMDFPVLKAPDTENILSKIMDHRQNRTYEETGQVDFSFFINPIGRCRVNIYRQRGCMAAALRLVGTSIPSPDELGLPESVIDLYQKKRGLVLVTGPTGSGKSTTLASLLGMINEKTNSHVITLEDPIEYLHYHKKSMINQREIGLDSRNYAEALRAALREDPDVILVGELQDPEVISIAVTAAETGHLVLSTLHTIGAASTIDRIIDVFPSRHQQQIRIQLATVLEAVITQQLVPTIGSDSRTAVFEVMQTNPFIRNLIKESKTHQIPSAIDVSMDDSLFSLYEKGRISLKTAVDFALNGALMLKRVEEVQLSDMS